MSYKIPSGKLINCYSMVVDNIYIYKIKKEKKKKEVKSADRQYPPEFQTAPSILNFSKTVTNLYLVSLLLPPIPCPSSDYLFLNIR